MRRRRVALLGASYASEHADVVDLLDTPDEISGADVVVAAAEHGREWAPTIRDRAPNAVVVVVGESPHEICETTLFPRARIIGLTDASNVAAVVDAIVLDRESEFETIVRCEGERGIEKEFAQVPVRVAGRGVVTIIEN